jgi:hypothetical protein
MSGLIQVVGAPGLNAALGAKRDAILVAIARGVFKGAMLIQKTARKKIMGPPKTGRVYGAEADVQAFIKGNAKQKKAAGKKVHQASAPGEAPANDLGNLQRSINIIAGKPGVVTEASVTANAEYASWLENGTLDGKIAPRPFLTPSMVESAQECSELLRLEITKEIQK